MFEKFLSANANDFRQRYEGTFGFFRNESGKRLLVRLDGIGDRVCSFIDANNQTYELYADSEKNIGFEFLPPKSGWYSTMNGAVIVQRVAARQFARGVNHRNITMHLLVMGGHHNHRVDFTSLSNVYEKALSLKDALPLFEKGELPSVALSPQLAMDATGTLWVLREAVGKQTRLKDSSYKITLNDKTLFRTEFADAFKAVGRQVTFD